MRVPGSNPTAPTFLGVKMAIFGHIWTQNGVLELLGALEPPKSALRGPILLAHGNSGHKLPKIRRGRFLGSKKCFPEHFENARFWQNPGSEDVLAF